MNRTRIEWVKNPDGTQGYTWNPIRGICPVNCKLPDGRSYCYARRMYQRFGWDSKVKIAKEYPEIIPMPMYDNKGKQISRKVFVCSTFELFHPSVKKEWRDWVFNNIKYNYHLTFQILTKYPQNIDREMPPNVWLGVTITRPSEMKRWTNLYFHQRANLKFVSFEPLLERLDCYPSGPDWIIVGCLTGYGNKYDPDISWIKDIVKDCANQGVKIFLKDNLRTTWGKNLIQQFPDGEQSYGKEEVRDEQHDKPSNPSPYHLAGY